MNKKPDNEWVLLTVVTMTVVGLAAIIYLWINGGLQ